ncbi:MAG TPA: acyclic terpene utilization AtuA family protein [Nocardioidaceae bacterium]|nr:acyclic terpene utilization AtuA family protein [Nocardioidaceae bacterium]
MADRSAVLRVGNCSGFYGDRLSAMREMLSGGELDVLTGDYLAELTMLILGRDRMKDPSLGYARTFVRQLEDCLGLALERGVRIVANAGGLNPAGLAERVREVASGLGLAPVVAHVEGDDLLDRVAELGLPGKPLTANAYLGGFGIAAALRAGADVVVTGRVTDASLVVGPAVARFGWSPTAYDELAGAVVAGHVLECGTQATGGNFSGFTRWTEPLGFPVAEVAADGSCVVTKHPGTGGEVTVDTVTAQLVYEIGSSVYLGPDVATHLDTVSLTQDGPDRVQVSGVRGSAPPDTLKVCVNELGGFRSSAELVLVGLDVEEKAAWVRAQVTAALADPPASVEWSLARTDHEDADTEEGASARLRVTVRDQDPNRVGKAFTAPLVELALASYPGFTLTAPPAPGTPYGVYRSALVDRSTVRERVVMQDGTHLHPERAASTPDGGRSTTVAAGLWPGHGGRARNERAGVPAAAVARSAATGPTRRVPLGTIAHARSGDKGGDANVGVWARDGREDRAAWLRELLTPERVKALLPEAADLDVEVHPLPNLRAVNVVLRGLLGEGVAASSRFDPQAKAVGEWLRSRYVDVPEALL